VAKPVCVIAGVGPGIGQALASKFASEGYAVAMLARTEARLRQYAERIPGAHAYACDVSDFASVEATFDRLRADLGRVRVLIHNATTGRFTGFMETTADALAESYRVNVLALLSCGQRVVPDMLQEGGGAILVIGATASLRGSASTAGIAPSKAAQRILAQSMSRSLGPHGIHVACLVIDGVIDLPEARRSLQERAIDSFVQPSAVADTAFHVVSQDRSAWTFELDLRPYSERW